MNTPPAVYFPAEWVKQDAVLLSWPHENTDWSYMLSEVQECFVHIAEAISDDEDVIIVTPEPESVAEQLSHIAHQERIHLYKIDTNDTWARDFGAITVKKADDFVPYDFKFNGWGLKFASDKDNLINRNLEKYKIFSSPLSNHLNFVLEGGSVESDDRGVIMTTSNCLLSPNRNGQFSRDEIENYLKHEFGAEKILWVDYGELEGDDTDSHIDTLARFIPGNTIVYTKCDRVEDSHYEELEKMGEQIRTFTNADGEPYNFVTLPLPDAIYDEDGLRLPATYANFLITNNSVLMPVYNQAENDRIALETMQKAMPGYKITGIDCNALIKQHGSLHCVTMQFPEKSVEL